MRGYTIFMYQTTQSFEEIDPLQVVLSVHCDSKLNPTKIF